MSDRLVVIADAGPIIALGIAGQLDILAKRRGLVPAVRPLLETMRAGGYDLAESLVDLAARQVGE